MTKYIYLFSADKTEGDASQKELLGGKGANLAEMCRIGIPVPPGFTISTEVCSYYYNHDKAYPAELNSQIDDAIIEIEKLVGKSFGDNKEPLLLSVRSGARASMPGMMDTILNLGLNDHTVETLVTATNDARFAYDSYRRFIQMFGEVVKNINSDLFEHVLDEKKYETGSDEDTSLTADDWKDVIQEFKQIYQDETGTEFPQDVRLQLQESINAVFESWNNPRAITYRRLHDIPAEWGTAVNIQAMVFGNMGEKCATGVAFTRNPSNGIKEFYGEYLPNAQGEDVVAGIRTPLPLTKPAIPSPDFPSLEETMPNAYKELCAIRDILEKHFQDMQDIEFTIQEDKLWMLQTRSGKRTAAAAMKIAVDMVDEKLIDKEKAISRIDPESIHQLLHPMLDESNLPDALTKGLPASPGAATGKVIFSSSEAEKRAAQGEAVILVRNETCPDDIHGMHAAKGILTARGGMTSHAAVVARGMGCPCVCGAGEIQMHEKEKFFQVRDMTFKEGDEITIDGTKGVIYQGQLPMITPELADEFQTILNWADEFRSMNVRVNAETPNDVRQALEFGAEGIGLCRTEHMFFDPERILAVREMILAEHMEDRMAALEKIEPMQSQDFYEIFKLMKNLPVTIRLLDPPLHEFLPHTEEEITDLSSSLGKSADDLDKRIQSLSEMNPMLGHRGCRLGITNPEIYEMQIRAIFKAVAKIQTEDKLEVKPEIMIPLTTIDTEVNILKQKIEKTIAKIADETNQSFSYMIGTMIELPRAALRAHNIAQSAEFFSFGTNDLTQATLGLSRDDAGKFLEHYVENDIYPQDPFMSIDVEGVGELVKIGVERGRSTKADLKIGICGEHGGDPKSIHFFHSVGLDYVSCSPFRIPLARLAAAQAELTNSKKKPNNVKPIKQSVQIASA